MTPKKKTKIIHKAAKQFNSSIKERKHKKLEDKQAFAYDIAIDYKINPEFFIKLMIQNDRNLYYR